MRERFTKTTYNYDYTWFRNLIGTINIYNYSGGRPMSIMKVHRKNAGVGAMRYDHKWEMVTEADDPDDGEYGSTTTSRVDTGVGPSLQVVGAVDVADQIHRLVNNHRPSCKVSFICTLSFEGDVLPKEDLELLIDYKVNTLLTTPEGRKIVQRYHKLGSVLERKMQTDLNKQKVYKFIYERWLSKVVEAVRAGDGDTAEDLYNECVEYLVKRYGVKYNGV